MASWTGKIYLTTNNINGKIYVGQTTVDSCKYLGSGVAIIKAFQKYGKENFSRVILRNDIENGKELDFWEEFYINLFDSCNKEYGYNIKKKGSSRGYKHSQEAKDRISRRSRKKDNMTHIRKIQKIAVTNAFGVPKTKETRLKISKTKSGQNRLIEIYNNNILFDSCNMISEAVEITGVKMSNIKNNLYGISQSAGGYVFKYKII